MGWAYGGITVDVSALYVWNVANMEWTPGYGNWFCDLGAGVNLGGASNFFHAGVQGMAKIGFEFDNAPIRLSLDWSPAFGPEVAYSRAQTVGDIVVPRVSVSSFNERGLVNLGLSCVYLF
jgi:hypothetical protein